MPVNEYWEHEVEQSAMALAPELRPLAGDGTSVGRSRIRNATSLLERMRRDTSASYRIADAHRPRTVLRLLVAALASCGSVTASFAPTTPCSTRSTKVSAILATE